MKLRVLIAIVVITVMALAVMADTTRRVCEAGVCRDISLSE